MTIDPKWKLVWVEILPETGMDTWQLKAELIRVNSWGLVLKPLPGQHARKLRAYPWARIESFGPLED